VCDIDPPHRPAAELVAQVPQVVQPEGLGHDGALHAVTDAVGRQPVDVADRQAGVLAGGRDGAQRERQGRDTAVLRVRRPPDASYGGLVLHTP